ncbi:hypothetical protein TIFTF001_012299 [Ficus carica]|uniref:DC1 domain-containing protein n=1 Tax=Ficus carica TaxID=3494 RepID=A0AA88D3K2_FICCA|nr:hypothetical protein TIFTF001_012299 [Ficus carica]
MRPISHFSHEHVLQGHWVSKERVCNMCNGPISIKLYHYFCSQCRYYIHKECAKWPEHIDHSLHPPHRLTLQRRSLDDNVNRCCYCEKPFENYEYLYACEQLCSDFYMHRACAMIPVPTIMSNIDGSEEHNVVHFSCHQQPTILVDHRDSHKSRATCFACQSNRSGPVYSCTSKCVSLHLTVKCQSHDHLLSLVEKSSCEIQCDACQKSYEIGIEVVPEEFNHTRSLLFRCMDCTYNLHFLCGPLPHTINYEYHMHPLILSDHSVSKDDSNEYYCDVCEEERDQSFRIYYCEECKHAAHIHCLRYEIMKALKGDTEDAELEALGENRWNVLAIKSKDHQAKENLEKSTLKNIVDMLTKSEREMLIDPFGFNDSQKKVYRRNSYNLNDQGFGNFLFELKYFTPEEGLLKLLGEKYLRQQVENVDGYMIPETLARIFRKVLLKYGDLGGKRSLTPAMRSVTATLLCIVIDKMCKTKVEDITRDDLRHLHFYLTGIRNITSYKLNRYVDSFKHVVKSYLGFEAIRHEKGVSEKLDQRMATLEAEMERCKENREKLKRYTSEMSNFMKECWSKALEEKASTWGDRWF